VGYRYYFSNRYSNRISIREVKIAQFSQISSNLTGLDGCC
jgi:hypothetical protein